MTHRQLVLVWTIAIGCWLALSGNATAQAPPEAPVTKEPVRWWRQSIERPSRGWDYDGKSILGHIGHDVCLWSAESGKLLHKLPGHKERIHAVQLSPAGDLALSSSWMSQGGMTMQISRDTSVILWDLKTGRQQHRFKTQVAGEFSPDGTQIVTFSQQPGTGIANPDWGVMLLPSTGETWQRGTFAKFDAAAIWDTATGRQVAKAKLTDNSDPKWDALHFSPDGSRIVCIANGAFLLYNSSGGVVFSSSDGHELGKVSRDVARFGDGHRYTSGGALATLDPHVARLIDLESGRLVQSMPHERQGIWGTAWTHDGSRFAAIASGAGALRIGDLASRKVTTGAKVGHSPHKAVVSPDNERLAVEWGGVNVEGRDIELGLGIYDMRSGEEITSVKLAKSGYLVGFSPDSKSLLVGGSKFVIYNAHSGEPIRTLDLFKDVSSPDDVE